MTNLKFSNKKEPFYDVEIDEFGNVYYYNKNGQLYRLNGPAIEKPNGFKAYYINNKLNRLNGPAVEFSDGSIEYWVNNKLHRLDGPARIWSNGRIEYWVNGKKLTKEEFDRLTKHND